MKYIKNTVLFLMIAVFSFSCSDNNVAPTEPDVTLNSGNEKSGTTTQSSTTIRYDDLPDVAEFVVDGRRWHHYSLTYYFKNGTSDIAGTQEKQAIEDAMDLWANVTDFSFTEISSESNAEIVIRWATGTHGDGSAFDGTNGVLAHAFYPPPNGGSYAGDMHFDDAENWTLATRSNNNQPMDLVTVAAHELGHSLGLGHSQYSNALMAPFYNGSHRFLSQDDLDGIDYIYPLEISISGPDYADAGETQFFNSLAHNAEGSVSYQWYYRVSPSQSWIKDVGATSSNYSRLFDNPGGYENQAVKVEVTSAGETASDVHPVEVIICEDENHSIKTMAPCRDSLKS